MKTAATKTASKATSLDMVELGARIAARQYELLEERAA